MIHSDEVDRLHDLIKRASRLLRRAEGSAWLDDEGDRESWAKERNRWLDEVQELWLRDQGPGE